jgi:hypothetical protein
METVKKTLIGLRDAFLLALFTTTIVVTIVNLCFDSEPAVEETLKQTFYYDLPDGENGVTCFTINPDSTVSAEYILNNATYNLDNVSGDEYERVMKTVYNIN